MARFVPVTASKSSGYDERNEVLVVQAGKKAQLYLVGGEGLDITSDDPDLLGVVSESEKDVKAAHRTVDLAKSEKGGSIRLIEVRAGGRAGTTKLAAVAGYSFATIVVHVVLSADRRQVGSAPGQTTQAMREELNRLTLREAVTRVAEDQMYSAISLGHGFGQYMPADVGAGKANWCGAFAFYCWNQAAAIKNTANPFGGDGRVLWSPQRAISWALRNPGSAEILRYKGLDPMDDNPNKSLRRRQEEFHDLGYNGHSLERGDIVMFRQLPVGGDDWRHVTQVDHVSEGFVHTVDGNQGTGHAIRRRKYPLNKKLSNGNYELSFLHVLV